MSEALHGPTDPTPAASGEDDLQDMGIAQALQFLSTAEMEFEGLLPWASNYTFLARLRAPDLTGLAVYKPQAGETPLWDFPEGTLALREYAAFVVSEVLGWRLVPPTVLRDGIHGPGMVQLFVDADPEEHYFTHSLVDAHRIQQTVAFDVVVNNADRKAGHVLRDAQDRLWLVDHGICFHVDDMLRTVIWVFAGVPIPSDIFDDLSALAELLQ